MPEKISKNNRKIIDDLLEGGNKIADDQKLSSDVAFLEEFQQEMDQLKIIERLCLSFMKDILKEHKKYGHIYDMGPILSAALSKVVIDIDGIIPLRDVVMGVLQNENHKSNISKPKDK